MNAAAVPFKLPNLFAGLAEGKGVARANPSELTLEFIVKESVLDIFKTGIKEVRVPQSEIASIHHKQGWFTDKVHIRLKSLRWLDALPGADTDEITLHVPRRHRSDTSDLVHLLMTAKPGSAHRTSI